MCQLLDIHGISLLVTKQGREIGGHKNISEEEEEETYKGSVENVADSLVCSDMKNAEDD